MINFWPDRAANDHVLIMMIDVDSETGERSEWTVPRIIEQ
jgi:hypothetical protein